MKFVDEASIQIRSGDGGPGAVSFMRQRGKPKMGPDGGDGGRGGHIYFEATHDLQSLLDFKFQSRYVGAPGEKGQTYNKNGKDGQDAVIRVPVGTMLFDEETGAKLVDLATPNEKYLLLQGGRGGMGNMNFATPTRQAPDFAQPGEPGQELRVRLELKLLADVGIVGFPNAGKSTLISRWSSARPKIADYPFTTLIPNLGVVRGKGRDMVVADIPGLIEGASEGKGLGSRFLKHCERTRALLILLDLDPHTGRSLLSELQILERELAAFSPELADKPRVVALNKIEAFADSLEEKGYKELVKYLGREPFRVSCVSGEGLDALKLEVERALS